MYKSVLVPLDGSNYAEKALEQAVTAIDPSGCLTLLRVVHTPEALLGSRQPDPADDAEKTEDMLARYAYDAELREAYRYVDKTKASLSEFPFAIHCEVLEGTAVEEILKTEKEVRADLIVLAAMGLSASSTPVKAGVFGRVADEVIKKATSPVLVIKPWSQA